MTISIDVILDLGEFKKGKFYIYDSCNLNLSGLLVGKPIESVSYMLDCCLDDVKINMAQLHIALDQEHEGLLAEFKKIKLKNKGYKWVVI